MVVVGTTKEDWKRQIAANCNGGGIVRGDNTYAYKESLHKRQQERDNYIKFNHKEYHTPLMMIDAGAMRAMYKARTQQRSRLLTELTPSKMSQLKAS